ncbi:MAG: prepilin peptidase [Pseudomonadota bacterium]
MPPEFTWTIAAAAIAVGALVSGPLRIAARIPLRRFGGLNAARRWARASAMGFVLGTGLAILWLGTAFDPITANIAAVMGLLVPLALTDAGWRWLPLSWTLGVGAIAIAFAAQNDAIVTAALTAVGTAATLLGLKFAVETLFGRDGMGTGDVILATSLAPITGPWGIAVCLGLASLTGLTDEVLWRRGKRAELRQRYGVAFGTHIIGVFSLLWLFKAF